MKKYVINTYRGIYGSMEAHDEAARYAKSIGATVVMSESQIDESEPYTVEYFNGFESYYGFPR